MKGRLAFFDGVDGRKDVVCLCSCRWTGRFEA